MYDHATNRDHDTWKLAFLLRECNGDLICALADYYAGRGNASKWIQEKRWNGTEEGLDSIPFPETRDYVKKVLRLYNKYHEVYRGRGEE